MSAILSHLNHTSIVSRSTRFRLNRPSHDLKQKDFRKITSQGNGRSHPDDFESSHCGSYRSSGPSAFSSVESHLEVGGWQLNVPGKISRRFTYSGYNRPLMVLGRITVRRAETHCCDLSTHVLGSHRYLPMSFICSVQASMPEFWLQLKLVRRKHAILHVFGYKLSHFQVLTLLTDE